MASEAAALAEEAMRLFTASQALPPGDPSREPALRAPIRLAAIAHREALSDARGELVRIAGIAANAAYQLSLEPASRLRHLAWARVAVTWGRRGSAGDAAHHHPFAAFHASMFLAQALVRLASLAAWRRPRIGPELLALDRNAPSDRSAYLYAHLFSAAVATAYGWEIDARLARGEDLGDRIETMIDRLERDLTPAFVAARPADASKALRRSARLERLRSERTFRDALASATTLADPRIRRAAKEK